MVRRQLKNQIITLLKVNPHGLSQKKIAESVNAARATVRKYMKQLEEEGKVSHVPAGEFKVWKYNTEEESPEELFLFWIKLINEFLLSLKKVTSSKIDYKKLGKETGKKINFGEMIFKLNLLQIFPYSEFTGGLFPALLALSKIFLSILIKFFGEGELDPPTIFKHEKLFNYRIRNIDVEDTSIFPFLEGFLESQIKEEQGISIGFDSVINRSEKIIDFKVKYHHDKKFYEEIEGE